GVRREGTAVERWGVRGGRRQPDGGLAGEDGADEEGAQRGSGGHGHSPGKHSGTARRCPTPRLGVGRRPGARYPLRPSSANMNVHEYQAKEVLARYGVPVPKGIPVDTPDQAQKAFADLGGGLAVVKAQIHAGGRGKAGGVKLVRSADEAKKVAQGLLG